MTFPFLAERLVSGEWDWEQRCFNGRNIKKVLDRNEGKGGIPRGVDPRHPGGLAARLEVDRREVASEEYGRDTHFSIFQFYPEQGLERKKEDFLCCC